MHQYDQKLFFLEGVDCVEMESFLPCLYVCPTIFYKVEAFSEEFSPVTF